MLGVLVVTVAISTLLDMFGGASPTRPPGMEAAESEPYQDALVLAGFSVPALVLIWLIVSWSLRPLARASEQAAAVGPANPMARLSRAGLPAEILPLVHAVNGALDRMAAAIAAERRFTENAAHELRTPLAVLSLRLQRARHAQQDGTGAPDWPAIDADLAQLTRLIGQMLDLARKENAGRAVQGARPVVNLSRIAREAGALIMPMLEADGRALEVRAPDTLNINGDAADLRDAIVNLLENAAIHGRGRIDLDCRQDTREGQAVLRVTDQGPGIAPENHLAVFERFRKFGEAPGTGLGLAIVREVAGNHGGAVEFLQGAPSRVELRLPMAVRT